jgi:hypothetical protein
VGLDEGIDMRGDWIYDWVRVEMEYRAGSPVPRQRTGQEPSRHWRVLWAGLFAHPRVAVPRRGSAL